MEKSLNGAENWLNGTEKWLNGTANWLNGAEKWLHGMDCEAPLWGKWLKSTDLWKMTSFQQSVLYICLTLSCSDAKIKIIPPHLSLHHVAYIKIMLIQNDDVLGMRTRQITVEIRDGAQNELVISSEILSPANKREPKKGREKLH